MLNKMNGILKTVYKRNELDGSTCFGVETDEIDVIRNSDGYVYCVGTIPKWPTDTYLILNGSWEGDSFEIDSAIPYTETEEMSKKLLKQIVAKLKEEDEDFKLSPTGIKRILSISGIDILSFIKREGSLDILIKNAPKIKEEKLTKIHEELVKINESYNVFDFISKFGCTSSHCSRLIELYGPYASSKLKKNPYRAGYKAGMDFYTIDRIAASMNHDGLSKERVRAIIYEALDQILTQSGSTYAIHSMLKKEVEKIARKSAYPYEYIPLPLLASTIQEMTGVVIESTNNGMRIYRRELYYCEKTIAFNLRRLDEKETWDFEESLVAKAEAHLKISYSDRQKDAFNILKSSGVKIITGGPGTGKTTLVNGILFAFMEMNPKKTIKLCAPTGRAAQRLTEITSIEAETIHRLLEFQPFDNGKMRHKDSENMIDADFIIVDEMSMVDTELFSLLLPAIRKGSILLLIGDENQLQSVSPGNILHDLIKTNKFEMHRLNEVFRQKGKGIIVNNAYKVLEGNKDFELDETFEVIKAEDRNAAISEVVKAFYDIYTESDTSAVQILSPVKVGECGTKNINDIISKRINEAAPEEEKETFCFRHTVYNLGDKVIFHRNNYEKEYYNGDIGYITKILEHGFYVKVGEKTIRVTGDCLRDVSLAYAITIHKSQGSEAQNVIIILPDAYANMLNRNMLFTAITRAKNHVKIIYINDALDRSIHTIKVDKRYTGLYDKIIGIQREVLN